MNIKEKLSLYLRFKLWARLRANAHPSYNISHSQFGEDMLIRALLGDTRTGFYVDIGAHHPVYYSNTYHFYCKGWRGINIDATPSSMQAFRVLRPRDINLELCLSSIEDEEVEFYVFDQSAHNTFDKVSAAQKLSSGVTLRRKHKLQTTTIMQCLDKFLPHNTQIDFMSIDVEGLDEAILMSNDWERYHPNVLVFEMHTTSIEELCDTPIIKFLGKQGYEIAGRCGLSIVLNR